MRSKRTFFSTAMFVGLVRLRIAPGYRADRKITVDLTLPSPAFFLMRTLPVERRTVRWCGVRMPFHHHDPHSSAGHCNSKPQKKKKTPHAGVFQ